MITIHRQLSPFEQIYQPLQDDSRAESDIPERWTDAEAFIVVHKVVVVVIPLDVVEIFVAGVAVVDVIMNHIVTEITDDTAGKQQSRVEPIAGDHAGDPKRNVKQNGKHSCRHRWEDQAVLVKRSLWKMQ